MSNKLMGSASIIIDSERKVLLVKHTYGKKNWELPGGKAEIQESVQETAKREVLEETGLCVEVGDLTGVYYDPMYDMHHFAFISQNINDEMPKPNSPEISECRYYSFEELPKPISDFTIMRIEDAINRYKKDLFHVIGPRQWME
ncbi:NUDIX domain-containing protein [Virgibacillus sp. L01]|uniref:NUDIX domain-containing protein n=1 Tax=Virgibacillus sp. L01 TaxID=3457429 RepID=UPI003FD0D212